MHAHAHTHRCMQTHTHTHTRMHTHTRTHRCTHTRACALTRIYTHTISTVSEFQVELLVSNTSSGKSAEQSVIGCINELPFILQLHTAIFTILHEYIHKRITDKAIYVHLRVHTCTIYEYIQLQKLRTAEHCMHVVCI